MRYTQKKGAIAIYGVDASDAQELLCYHDLYTGNLPEVRSEIEKLNMHKFISIISKLINASTDQSDVDCKRVLHPPANLPP